MSEHILKSDIGLSQIINDVKDKLISEFLDDLYDPKFKKEKVFKKWEEKLK